MTRLLGWVRSHRMVIVIGLCGLGAGYLILISVVPWRACRPEGYLIAVIAVIALVVLEAADLVGRDGHPR